MDQLKKLIFALSPMQRITLVVAALAVVGGLFSFSHWKRESDFKPLYSSLAPEDAGAVVQKLKESATEYRLSDNGTTVLAPSGKVAELRLELAAAGVPKSGRIGFELFDKNNFGATEFTEHINYRRALEGELERSMISLSEVEQARVHLTFPKESVFLDSRQPAKASVVLRLRPGVKLSAQNVIAVTNLVAGAVEGLGPEAVSVVDSRGTLLNRPRTTAGLDENQPSEALLDYKQRMESSLLTKINATLEPLLGADKYRAAVSVDCDFSSGEQSDETLDPTKSVMVTSQKTEENTGSSVASGTPGTASNLPRPTSKPAGATAGVSRRTENIAYQSSRTVKHVRFPQGSVKRMSLSVLVDQTPQWEGTGAKAKFTMVPPSPEKLKAIRDLVAGISGFVADRGDQIVVETLPFESTLTAERPVMGVPDAAPVSAAPKWLRPVFGQVPLWWLLAGALAAAAIMGVAAAVLLKRPRRAAIATNSDAIKGAGPGARIVSETVEPHAKRAISDQDELQHQLDTDALNGLRAGVVTSNKADVLVKHLREAIDKNSENTTNVLRTWLGEGNR